MGMWWDEERSLYLLTLEEYVSLPDGFQLTAIDGEKVVKGSSYIDMDTRMGCMAYGVSHPSALIPIVHDEKRRQELERS
jgi:hypothetical protein